MSDFRKRLLEKLESEEVRVLIVEIADLLHELKVNVGGILKYSTDLVLKGYAKEWNVLVDKSMAIIMTAKPASPVTETFTQDRMYYTNMNSVLDVLDIRLNRLVTETDNKAIQDKAEAIKNYLKQIRDELNTFKEFYEEDEF